MIGGLAALGTLLSLGHLGAAAVAAWRLRGHDELAVAARATVSRGARGAPGAAVEGTAPSVDVLLIRPCAGAAATLASALASTAGARTRHRLRVVFAVADASDAAALPAARAAAALRGGGLDAEMAITGAAGANAKASQLAAVLARGPQPDVVLVADDDLDLDGTDLDALADAVLAGRAGAAWAPPVEVAPCTPADHASAAILGASLHAFPVLHALDGAGMVGKLFAVRAEALAEVGGFAALRDVLGEDVELARRLRSVGWRVGVAPLLARSLAAGRDHDAVVARYARWISMVRGQRPHLLAAYPACFLAPLLSLGMAAAALPFAPLAAATCGGAALLARGASAALAASRSGRGVDRSLFRDALAGDVVLARAFARAMARRGFEWRGRRLVVDEDGTLREAGAHAAA